MNKLYNWNELYQRFLRIELNKLALSIREKKFCEEIWKLVKYKNSLPLYKKALEDLKIIIISSGNLDNPKLSEWVIDFYHLFSDSISFDLEYLDHLQNEEYPHIFLHQSRCLVDIKDFQEIVDFYEFYSNLYYSQKHLPINYRNIPEFDPDEYYNRGCEEYFKSPEQELLEFKEALKKY